MKKIYAFTIASLKMMVRNKANIFWSLFFPLMLMLIFGLFNTSQETISVAVINGKGVPASISSFANDLSKQKGIKLTKNETLSEADKSLKAGNTDLIIDIEKNTSATPEKPQYKVDFYINKSSQVYSIAELLETQIKYSFLEQTTKGYNLVQFNQITQSAIKDYSYVSFLTPGIVALAIMQGIIFSVMMILITYREESVLRRIFLTTVTKFEFLTSLSLTRIIMALSQAAILIYVALLVYNVKIIGNTFLLAFVIILGALMFISLGLLISSLVNKIETASAVANVITLPMMFLSGLFFPLSALPKWLSDISQYFPLTYLINALRGVYISGDSFTKIINPMLGMLVWLVIFTIINIWAFKWE